MAPPRTVPLTEDPVTGCLEWGGSRTKDGYGKCCRWVDGVKYHLAHRWAWAEVNGHTDMLVCHHCDNPACCNVSHMFLGTDLDNARDRVTKGRSGHTPPVPKRVLTDDDIGVILSSNESQYALADRFGVTQPTISYHQRKHKS